MQINTLARKYVSTNPLRMHVYFSITAIADLCELPQLSVCVWLGFLAPLTLHACSSSGFETHPAAVVMEAFAPLPAKKEKKN